MTGIIIKGIAGFYYVAVEGSGIYECKAKGLFRKNGCKPLVGDRVSIKILDEENKEANIEELLPRKNELYRPAVANVDQIILIMAFTDPEPNLVIMDRMLVQMERLKVPVIICFNKFDLADEARAEHIKSIYESAGYRVIVCSTVKNHGMDELRKAIAGKTTVLAGPSGVGKSSVTNVISPEIQMETGEISAKLKKGRHTTRHSQLIVVEPGTYICDTPGFTSFSPEPMAKENLRLFYPEMLRHEGECRFSGCVHVNEPGCAVKEAVQKGEIFKERYESYVLLFNELKEHEKNRYR